MDSRFSARVLLLTALLAGPVGEVSGQSQPTILFGGEIRPRLLAREPVQDQWDHWVSMRTRLSLDARFRDGVGLFVQVQDVRFWGEESSNRDRSADAVDFHQAFIDVEDLPGIGGDIRAGRQEVSLAEGRFISAPDWGQAGQSFDGLRWTRDVGDGHLDLVYLRLREGSAPLHEQSADFTAAWLAQSLGDVGTLDLLAIHDRYREAVDTDRTTVGSTFTTEAGGLSFRVQGVYQFGDRLGRDLSAFMVAARGTAELAENKATISLWYDHLSGDDRPEDSDDKAFSTLFGARHRFFGRADYFRDLPEDVDGLGLRDLALKFTLRPTPLLTVNTDLHTFRTAVAGRLTATHLGDELDIWARYRFRGAMDLEAGYTLMMAGTALEELGRLEGTGHTFYFMTSLAF